MFDHPPLVLTNRFTALADFQRTVVIMGSKFHFRFCWRPSSKMRLLVGGLAVFSMHPPPL